MWLMPVPEPLRSLLHLQVPPAIYIGLNEALAFLGWQSGMPGHGLDLGSEDTPGLGLDLLLGELRHRGGITRDPRPRQIRRSE